VQCKYEQDKSLGHWVDTQRRNHVINKMRLDRKRILDEIGFVWNVRARAVRSSTTDVRGLGESLDRSTLWADIMFLTLVLSSLICVDFRI
jgi:hypothetical protein